LATTTRAAAIASALEDAEERVRGVGAGGPGLNKASELGLDKAEDEIAWLGHMLEAVKDHPENMRKGLIENFLELKNRLDRLEGTP
jgi:hypothetical protein